MKKIIFVLALLLAPSLVSAATVEIQTRAKTITPGSDIIATVVVETATAAGIFSGAIALPEGTEVLSIHDGGGAVGVWSEHPHIRDGVVRFTGVTPGGMLGRGELFSLNIKFNEYGRFPLSFDDISIRAFDEKERELSVESTGVAIVVSDEGEAVSEHFGDLQTPEPFVPLVTRDPERFDGDWFVTWNSQGAGNGPLTEEIIETRNVFRIDGEAVAPREHAWRPTKSPYVLEDQSLSSFIFIRLTDAAGNSQVAMIPPSRPPLSIFDITGIAAFLALIIGALYYYNTRGTHLKLREEKK